MFPIESWGILLISLSFLLFYGLLPVSKIPNEIRILFATSIVVSPPFVEQSLWPATTLPSIAVIFVLSLIQEKIRFQYIYVLAGIFLFGGMQNLYFMTPLLFIHKLIENSDKHIKFRILLDHAIWWILGCIIGVLISLVMVYIVTGQLGLNVAPWRKSQPIHDLSSALNNISLMKIYFFDNVKLLLSKGGFTLSIIILTLSLSINLVINRNYLLILIATTSVAVSYFAFSVPLAPVIQTRTLLPFSAAVVFMFILLNRSKLMTIFNAINMMYFCSVFTLYSANYINEHKSVTSFFYNKIENLLDRNINYFDAFILKGKIPEDKRYAYFFNSAPLMHSIMYSLGAKSFWDCREGSTDSRCQTLLNLAPVNVTDIEGGKLILLTDVDQKLAVLQFSMAD
ncbi:hypothetical protein [Brucella thiophenivorans]|nr:hypothetical protein [Brucella thiophenivorans]